MLNTSTPPCGRRHRTRLPHWGWLFLLGTMLVTGAVILSISLPTIRATRAISAIRLEGGGVGVGQGWRPKWLPPWLQDQTPFIPFLDSLEQINATAGTESAALDLIDLGRGITSLTINFDNVSSAELLRLAQARQLTRLILEAPELTDEDLWTLRTLSCLERVSIRRCSAQGKGLEALAADTLEFLGFEGCGQVIQPGALLPFTRLPSLKGVGWAEVAFSDEAISEFVQCPRLDSLAFEQVPLTPWQISQIGNLKTLIYLRINDVSFDGMDPASFSSLTKLESLDLTRTTANDGAVAGLKNLPSLRFVNLSDTPIGDNSAEALFECRELYSVGLERTGVTDLTLQLLEHHPQLRFIDVTSTRCTRDGVETFRTMRSDVHVRFGPP